MHNFKQFIESEEEDNKILRIKLRPWPTNPDSPPTKTSPTQFINLFNAEVEAKDHNSIKYYIDQDSLVSYSIKPIFNNYVYVSDLQVQPRGIAAIKFLQKLTRLADKHQITLTCISEPLNVDNKVDQQRLTNLYKKFGFKPKSPNSDNLVRLPK
jgi:hypothetical protein